MNPTDRELSAMLARVRSIAVVGLSPKEGRPSYQVSAAMQRFGYRIVPVRPATGEILGERAYPSLAEMPEPADLVNVFRESRHLEGIVDQCIALGFKAVWAQEGIHDEIAEAKARAAGIAIVTDRCIYKDYLRLNPSGRRA